MQPRDFISFLKRNTNYPLQIAEVGVYLGENALSILENLDIEHLFLVDPYKSYLVSDSSIPQPYSFTQELMDNLMNQMVINLGNYKEKVSFFRLPSTEVASFLPNRSLDCVYIDANHAEKYVEQDILAWFPKVKNGGILAGHDYLIESVRKSVDNFTQTNKLELIAREDWIIKK